MAAGDYTDLKIYDDQVQGGQVETLVQETQAFNAASAGAIVMNTNRKPGHYDFEAFWQNTASLISRRDIGSVAAATDTPVTQGEDVAVKLNRKVGPVAQTLDAFRKIGSQAGVNSLSFLIGTQIAKGQMAGWLNDALLALRATLAADAAAANDITLAATKTCNTLALVDTLAKFGDAADRVGIWVMHSKAFYDLVKDQITNYQFDSVGGVNIASAAPVTLNRPVLVTDSASLVVSGTPDTYYSLGLPAGAAVVTDSEEDIMHAEIVTGQENLLVRLQGEYAFNLKQKGRAWDTTNGGINPDATAVGTATNWDSSRTAVADRSGVILVHQ